MMVAGKVDCCLSICQPAYMQRFFSTKMPGVTFVMNVLIFSLIGLLPVLLVYVMRAPGFASALMDSGPALSRFLRQVLTNGLPVIFIVNYVGFFLFAVLNAKDTNSRDPAVFILFDVITRVALFLVLHASFTCFPPVGSAHLEAVGRRLFQWLRPHWRGQHSLKTYPESTCTPLW